MQHELQRLSLIIYRSATDPDICRVIAWETPARNTVDSRGINPGEVTCRQFPRGLAGSQVGTHAVPWRHTRPHLAPRGIAWDPTGSHGQCRGCREMPRWDLVASHNTPTEVAGSEGGSHGIPPKTTYCIYNTLQLIVSYGRQRQQHCKGPGR